MVKLPKRVLERWRELSSESRKVHIELLLASRLDPDAAAVALSRSLDRILAAFEARYEDPPAGEDEPCPGEWDVTPVPEGAMLTGGYKCDAFEEMLSAIVEDLGREGVTGKLDLYALPPAPEPPFGIGVIEAGVRVLGRRVTNGRDRWAADRTALLRVVAVAVEWCLQSRPDLGVTIRGSGGPTLLVRRCDCARDKLLDAAGGRGRTTLCSVGADRFRGAVVAPAEGRVTVFEGGPLLHAAGWRPSVDACRGFLQSVSDDIVYGRVRQAHQLRDAEAGYRERKERLGSARMDATAHEDHGVPDAFAIQVLGPGYSGRLPSGTDWRFTDLGKERMLVVHCEPAPWFDELTLAEAFEGESIPRRIVLERARSEFDALLLPPYTDEERERERAWGLAHPYVRLSDALVAKVHALPTTPFVDHWDVALVMRDGSIVEDVALGSTGSIVKSVAGDREVTLDPAAIVDVLDRATHIQ